MGKSKKASGFKYTLESSMRSVSLKFYDEQIIRYHGSDEDKDALSSLQMRLDADLSALGDNPKDDDKKALVDAYNASVASLGDKVYPEFVLQIATTDPKKMEIVGIRHDLDTLTNDFFVPACEKRHYHVLGFCSQGIAPYKLRSWLKAIGVVFSAEDDGIVKSIETVSHKCEMLNYLTHDTDAARKDGKYLYDDSRLVSNLDASTLDLYRDRGSKLTTAGYTQEEYTALSDSFYNLGYSAKSFDDNYFALAAHTRLNRSLKSMLQEVYFKGLKDSIVAEPEVDRLCIYIEGKGNTSKSYSSLKAAKELYENKVFVVDGGRTGSFDDFAIDTRCIIVNDYFMPNILNVCDNKKAKLYKRNTGTPYFVGDTVIVTGNKPFNTWIMDCNINDKNQRDAMATRFFVCKMVPRDGSYQAEIVSMPTSIRGNHIQKVDRAVTFLEHFNAYASTYKPVKQPVLPSALQARLDKVYKEGYMDIAHFVI